MGDVGCFRAGQVLHRRSGLDFRSTSWTRARAFFDKACAGGFAEGCLFAAQMIEAPYGEGSSEFIPDARVLERETLLRKACDSKLASACKRLGDVFIGKSAKKARAAYEAACSLEDHAAACRQAREKEVAAFNDYEARCTRGLPDDCALLGYLVYRVDVPRAKRIFQAEYGLRGIGRFLSESDFIRERAKAARAARVPVPGQAKPDEQVGDPELLALGGVTVEGRLARIPAARRLRANGAKFAACASTAAPGAQASVELIVDLTGDVWRSRIDGDWPPGAVRCLTQVSDGIQFLQPAGGVAIVRFDLSRAQGQTRSGQPAVSK